MNSVMMPKLPPPPRIAQKRSWFSEGLAVTMSPSAVTTWADRRLSMARPYLADHEADAAAGGQAAEADGRCVAGGESEAVGVRRAGEVAGGSAGLDARRSRLGVDADAVHVRQVADDRAVDDRVADDAVPAAAHGHAECRRGGRSGRSRRRLPRWRRGRRRAGGGRSGCRGSYAPRRTPGGLPRRLRRRSWLADRRASRLPVRRRRWWCGWSVLRWSL